MCFFQLFLTSENSDGLCHKGKIRPWGWSTSNKTERETTSASSPPLPPPSPPPRSSHWMPPHWSPLRPWLPAGVPLTFNLWPPARQNSSQSIHISALSGEDILWNTVMATEWSDGEYRCQRRVQVLQMFFTPSSPWPPPPSRDIHDTLHPWDDRNPLSVCHALNLCLCVFACHGPICPDAPGLKRGSCCSLMESCLLQRDPVTRALRFHPY